MQKLYNRYIIIQRIYNKTLEDLNIIDDFLFNEIVSNKEYGEIFINYFLKTVLINEVEIKDATAQLIYTSGDPNKRAIRVDVVTKGTLESQEIDPVTGKKKETYIDIEMQNKNSYLTDWKKNNLRNRSRLYQALLDASLLKPGQYFGEIPNVLIIFCMPFDLFGRDRMMYTFKHVCQEEPDLALEDGAKRIFLNTKGKKGARKELRDMLKYIEETTEENVASKEIEKIHSIITALKKNKKVGDDYMLSQMREMTIRTEGIEQGIKKIVLALIDTLDIQTISEKTGLSVEAIENMKKEESQS